MLRGTVDLFVRSRGLCQAAGLVFSAFRALVVAGCDFLNRDAKVLNVRASIRRNCVQIDRQWIERQSKLLSE